ncbi:hypothetical protein NAV28_06900 [Pseudomonas stutzeri]|nr:hypothetical protein [Stutzerimonas degradans]
MATTSSPQLTPLLPRILRANAAPAYLGMCRSEFNRTVRPFIREFPIGVQGVGFDRLELDAWADAYIAKASIEKSGAQGEDRPCSRRRGGQPWRKEQLAVSTNATASGTSTRSTEVSAFEKALAQVTGRRRSNI